MNNSQPKKLRFCRCCIAQGFLFSQSVYFTLQKPTLLGFVSTAYKTFVFMNYYSGCGHFTKDMSYKWNKNTLFMFIIIIHSHHVNGSQYSRTGIGEMSGMQCSPQDFLKE